MQQNNGFDKSQIINMVIFSVLIFGTMFYYQYITKDKQAAEKSKTEQISKTTTTPVNNTAAPVTTNTTTPTATPAATEKVSIKNDLLTLEVSSLGGQLSSVRINTYNAYDKEKKDKPLYLFSNHNSSYGFQFKDKSGKVFNTKDLIFTPQVSGNTVTMQTNLGDASIQFIYTLLPQYTVDFKVRTVGLSQVIGEHKADFVWDYQVREAEKGRAQEQSHTEFVYAFDNYNGYDYDARSDMDESKETLNWLGVKQQFFSAVIESKSGFTQSKGSQETIEKGEFLKKFNYNGQVALSGSELNQDFTWYFMPLELPLLKSYNKNFEEILPLGWSFIRGLNTWFFIPVYEFIANWGLAAGWAIFLLTIIVKIILSPIMFKQHKLSAMMKVIRPEVDAVNEKFKKADPMKKQQAVLEVYRKAGVNQLAGCIPALLQIPIFYALFRFFPNYIDFRGKSFWFAEDLSSYDDVIKLPFNVPLIGEHISIFALACTVVILIYTVMTSGNMQQPQQEGMPNMKILMYIFPITFLFFLNTSSSGLSWYYLVSNALNIVIILIIKHFIIDEDKIHAQIQENKAKPVKEGRFQKKMREMMEQAQEQQKQQARKK